MAQIYIKDETRKDLDEIAKHQHRDISDELALMVEKRKIELGIDARQNSKAL